MNRRSIFRIFGLGVAAGAGEAVVGPAWLGWGGPLRTTGMLGQAGAPAGDTARVVATERVAYGVMDQRLLDQLVEARAAKIEAEREYMMTDWGGAL